MATPKGVVHCVEGISEGMIAEAPKGEGGFGYDPLFIDKDSGKTYAELPQAVKNSISHRGRALRKAKDLVRGFLEQES